MPHAYLTPRPIFPRPFDCRQADTVEKVSTYLAQQQGQRQG